MSDLKQQFSIKGRNISLFRERLKTNVGLSYQFRVMKLLSAPESMNTCRASEF